MIADFPGGESKAVCIADASLFCLVTLLAMVGAFSYRYGKKWFIVLGCVGGCIGSAISGTAKDVNTIIGGQAITGAGSCFALVTVAVGMEIVPSKYRGAAVAGMAVFNGVLGAIGGVVICELCHVY
jgi:MFS family permease